MGYIHSEIWGGGTSGHYLGQRCHEILSSSLQATVGIEESWACVERLLAGLELTAASAGITWALYQAQRNASILWALFAEIACRDTYLCHRNVLSWASRVCAARMEQPLQISMICRVCIELSPKLMPNPVIMRHNGTSRWHSIRPEHICSPYNLFGGIHVFWKLGHRLARSVARSNSGIFCSTAKYCIWFCRCRECVGRHEAMPQTPKRDGTPGNKSASVHRIWGCRGSLDRIHRGAEHHPEPRQSYS